MEDKIFLLCGKSTLAFEKSCFSASLLKKRAAAVEGIEENSLYFTYHGKIVHPFGDDFNFKEDVSTIRCNVRLHGGKGGFGSMLRALGAQIEKTTNREACRDLSGRRMRDVNNEKKIADWLEKEKRDEEERAKKKKEKLERILNPPRHRLNDSSYVNEIKENADKVSDALRQGLQNASDKKVAVSARKREHKMEKIGGTKKQKMWLDVNEDEEDLSSGSENEVETASPAMDCLVSPVDDTSPSNAAEPAVEEHKIQESQSIAESRQEEIVLEDNSKKKIASKEKENTDSNEDAKEATATKEEPKEESIDLRGFSTAEELEAFGLDKLKIELSKHGLKCGGTLQQRAQRLFLLKETPIDKLDASLFAKPSKKIRKPRNDSLSSFSL